MSAPAQEVEDRAGAGFLIDFPEAFQGALHLCRRKHAAGERAKLRLDLRVRHRVPVVPARIIDGCRLELPATRTYFETTGDLSRKPACELRVFPDRHLV